VSYVVVWGAREESGRVANIQTKVGKSKDREHSHQAAGGKRAMYAINDTLALKISSTCCVQSIASWSGRGENSRWFDSCRGLSVSGLSWLDRNELLGFRV
jgi:hypothetical protein